MENELQRIVIESTPYPTSPGSDKSAESDNKDSTRNLAIPAVHIQKLIDDYRKRAKGPKPEGQALSQPAKDDFPLNADRAATLIVEKLGVNHVNSVLRQLGKLDLGDNVERATMAILSAMEFHDPTVAPPYFGNMPPSYFAIETLKTLPRFSTGFPRERVRQLIVDALSDTHIDVALTAAQLVSDMLNELPDLDVKARLVDVPTKIVEEKFHDATASPAQRGQALRLLSKLRDRSAPAVPMLITLLKSSDVEFTKPENENTRRSLDVFTRERVILTLAAIGPPAKDALPILEAELAVLDKQAKEDALLWRATGSRFRETIGSTPASMLRIASDPSKASHEAPSSNHPIEDPSH